jgi:hypothetical protein
MTKWLTERVCLWCGTKVPDGSGVVCWSYHGMVHQGRCNDFVRCLERDFKSSNKGRIRRGSEVRQLIPEVRDKPLRAWLDFRVLVHLEPQLLWLLRSAQSCHRQRGERFCANEVWYGYGEHAGHGLKKHLLELVGYERQQRHAILSSSLAYDLAYDAIYDALPDCRGRCICL